MSAMTTLERSHSCTSSTSLSISSPRPSVQRENTPPETELSLSYLHDRINQLDSSVLELRSTVLTKDGYVDRRNREDDHIRREFEQHRAVYHRIDLNVVALRSDVDQVKTAIFQLRSSVGQVSSETLFLRSDVDRLQKSVDQLHVDLEKMRTEAFATRMGLEQMKTEACATRIDISQLRTDCSQLRADCSQLRTDYSQLRTDSEESKRVRFNSLAHTISAPINPIPVVADDGALVYPKYFPRTVWKFWCLKKRSRVHRLVELAEFYKLSGYQNWSRMHQDYDSDSSDSSDSSNGPSNITREEAVRRFPEAAHQALAATLGLVYYLIRSEVGEGPNSVPMRPPKRRKDDVASTGTNTKSKPVKMPRRPSIPGRPSVSDSYVRRLLTGPSVTESKSSKSEEFDILGWNACPDVSEDGMSKLRSMGPHDINAVLRAMERGRLKLKPSASEKARMSPTGSKASHGLGKSAEQAEVPTQPNTVPTEPITVSTQPNTVPTRPISSQSSKAKPASVPDMPDTASDTDSSTSS